MNGTEPDSAECIHILCILLHRLDRSHDQGCAHVCRCFRYFALEQMLISSCWFHCVHCGMCLGNVLTLASSVVWVQQTSAGLLPSSQMPTSGAS